MSHDDYDAMPAHKRPNYAERIFEAADMRRKERREEPLLDAYEQCDRLSRNTNTADDPL